VKNKAKVSQEVKRKKESKKKLGESTKAKGERRREKPVLFMYLSILPFFYLW
jgi:hypothetical protein